MMIETFVMGAATAVSRASMACAIVDDIVGTS
jgi:hypothetical protein